MEQPTEAGFDTSDMLAVHNVFRDAFGAAGTHVGSTDGGADAERVQLVGDYYRNVFAFLHGHHEGEDELITPLLVERVDDATEVERIAAQHTDVLGPLAEAEAALQAWSDAPDAGSSDALVVAISGLEASLNPHLGEEETIIVPLCAQHLSPAEWGALPGHGMATFQGDRIWLILGLIRDHMSESQKAEMLAHMPPPAVDMWTNFGNAAYDGFMAELQRA